VLYGICQGKNIPSKNVHCEEYEMYYPNLPELNYLYHPSLRSDKSYKDKYGNGGFDAFTYVEHEGTTIKVPRFYLYSREINANPFHFIGTGERNYKLNLIATYRSNVDCGVRVCVFATSDGGRQWFCKYEFADSGEYHFQQGHTGAWGYNHGNAIKLTTTDAIPPNIKIIKRSLSIPSSNHPNPDELFIWEYVADVDRLLSDTDGIKVTTLKPHKLKTGNVVVLSSSEVGTFSSEKIWYINNDYNSCSLGNGKVFKVVVDSPNSFHLFELVSAPLNNIPCRHIHHLNPIKDGWIIGTGEIYPNGWLLYFQNKKSDTYTNCNANDSFDIYRFTFSEASVQRTMGFILRDDFRKSVYFASDHDTLKRSSIDFTDLSISFSRGSTGVFVGELKDVNNRDKFECVYESAEPCFYFQQLGNSLFYCGQRGDLAIADIYCKEWNNCRIGKPIIKYFGNYCSYFIFDSCIVKIK